MRKLCGLAVAGLLAFGIGSAASAAPVAVTYGFAPGTAWSVAANFGGGASTGYGALTVVYASGTTAIGGAKTGPVSAFVQILGTGAAVTILGNGVPGWQAGPVGFAGGTSFSGPSQIVNTAATVNLPAVLINALGVGPATVLFKAAGSLTIGGGFITGNWTIGGAGTGAQEISRATVPEPSLAMLLAGGLGVLGLVTAGARRRARN